MTPPSSLHTHRRTCAADMALRPSNSPRRAPCYAPRWTGKKASKDAHGNHIEFVTVGSRTSAFVPALQKLQGGAGGGAGEAGKGGGKAGTKRTSRGKAKKEEEEDEEEDEDGESADEEEKPAARRVLRFLWETSRVVLGGCCGIAVVCELQRRNPGVGPKALAAAASLRSVPVRGISFRGRKKAGEKPAAAKAAGAAKAKAAAKPKTKAATSSKGKKKAGSSDDDGDDSGEEEGEAAGEDARGAGGEGGVHIGARGARVARLAVRGGGDSELDGPLTHGKHGPTGTCATRTTGVGLAGACTGEVPRLAWNAHSICDCRTAFGTVSPC